MTLKRYGVSLDDIKALLTARMESLATQLAPQGRRDGREWTALNPTRADGKMGSFRINLSTGLWADFATGDKGDPLALIAYLATGGDIAAAIRWAKDWLGLSSDGAASAGFRRAPVREEAARLKAAQDARQASDRDKIASAAGRIWDDARALTPGDMAWTYLAGRLIDVAALRAAGSPCRALRFHAGLVAPDDQALPIEERRRWPALIAKIETPPGDDGRRSFAIHRTYLEPRADGRVTKAKALRDPKLTLGTYRGGAIYLTRGALALPLAKCPPGQWISVTEGIEDGLSFALANPDRRVWAAVSLANMRNLVLPANVAGVELAAQNDPPGSDAERSLGLAAQRLSEQGLAVRIIRPPSRFKDWNDAICGSPKENAA